MASLQKVTQANLKLLFVSDPRVAKIFHTRAAGEKKKFFFRIFDSSLSLRYL